MQAVEHSWNNKRHGIRIDNNNNNERALLLLLRKEEYLAMMLSLKVCIHLASSLSQNRLQICPHKLCFIGPSL